MFLNDPPWHVQSCDRPLSARRCMTGSYSRLLSAQPHDIVARLAADPEEVARRPLLKNDDPQAKLEEILSNRRNQYSQVSEV